MNPHKSMRLLPPVLETGQPEKFDTQADIPADVCCRGGKCGLVCRNCINHPDLRATYSLPSEDMTRGEIYSDGPHPKP